MRHRMTIVRWVTRAAKAFAKVLRLTDGGLALATLLFSFGCSGIRHQDANPGDSSQSGENAPPDSSSALISSNVPDPTTPLLPNIDFTLDLLPHLPLSSHGNVVVSPTGLGLLVSLLADGAVGTTREELLRAIHRGEMESPKRTSVPGTVMKSRGWANAEWKVRKKFMKHARVSYECEIVPGTDGVAMKQWAQDLVGSDHGNSISWETGPFTALVLVNAARFDRKWATPFVPGVTGPETFARAKGDTVKTQYMYELQTCAYEANDVWHAVRLPYAIRLPYKESAEEAVLLLPRTFVPPAEFELSSARSLLEKIWDSDPSREVQLKIPRFSIASYVDAKQSLRALGVIRAWSSGTADFSGMFESIDVYLSRMEQEAMIEVNEQGTVAKAVTRAEVKLGVVEYVQPIPFVADHPFLFLVVHRPAKAVLFAAIVGDPTESLPTNSP